MCEKIGSLRAFCFIAIIFSVAGIMSNAVAVYLIPRFRLRPEENISACMKWLTGVESTDTKSVNSLAQMLVPNRLTSQVHIVALCACIICLIIMITGVIVAATVRIPGGGWSLQGASFICYLVALVPLLLSILLTIAVVHDREKVASEMIAIEEAEGSLCTEEGTPEVSEEHPEAIRKGVDETAPDQASQTDKADTADGPTPFSRWTRREDESREHEVHHQDELRVLAIRPVMNEVGPEGIRPPDLPSATATL